jgi:hypothetical protein
MLLCGDATQQILRPEPRLRRRMRSMHRQSALIQGRQSSERRLRSGWPQILLPVHLAVGCPGPKQEGKGGAAKRKCGAEHCLPSNLILLRQPPPAGSASHVALSIRLGSSSPIVICPIAAPAQKQQCKGRSGLSGSLTPCRMSIAVLLQPLLLRQDTGNFNHIAMRLLGLDLGGRRSGTHLRFNGGSAVRLRACCPARARRTPPVPWQISGTSLQTPKQQALLASEPDCWSRRSVSCGHYRTRKEVG